MFNSPLPCSQLLQPETGAEKGESEGHRRGTEEGINVKYENTVTLVEEITGHIHI